MIYPTQYGWHRYINKGNNNSTIKQNYVLHIVLDGHGIYRVKGKIYSLRKNQAFIVKPSEIVYYYPDPDYNDNFEYVWVGFAGDGVDAVLKAIGLDGFYSYVLDLKNTDKIKSYVFDMINFQGKETFNYMAKLYEIFQEIVENSKHESEGRQKDKSHNNNMVNYIHKNIKEVTVSSLCETFSMERSGLYKYFLREFKMSPQDYIIKNKLEIARELIVETNIDLQSVCTNSGFGNYSHFCRIFTKNFGCSPTEFRKNNSAKGEE